MASASPQVLAILGALVEERVGLHYGANELPLFGDKVAARASERGFDSLLDYYYYLRYDDPDHAEFDRLVEALVVHETYFFREAAALEVAIDEFVAPAIRERGRARVWSAACSTGEEPLTVAMLLAARGLLDRVDLLATDVSERALARARKGEFSIRSLRRAPASPLAERWLRVEGERVVCDRALVDAIAWRPHNLRSGAAPGGPFDVILCRNVLIYFHDDTTRAIVDFLASALRPGGALFVGVSESLLRFPSPLSCEERRGVFAYVKVAR